MPAPSIFSADWRNELLQWLTAAFQPLSAALTSWASVTRAAGFDAFAAAPSSANLRGLLTDETGTGAAYFQGGALGTPSSGTLTNCTGLPNASVIGLGTAALQNTGTSGANIPFLNAANTWSGVQTFSAVPSLSGGAITFPATQVPSAGANDLDDYEEGTWTPTIAFGGAAVGVTYGTRVATYTKIGRLVYANFDLALTSKGTSIGAAVVVGLPFTIAAVIGSCSVSFYSSMAGLTGGIGGFAQGTNINLIAPGATASATLTDTNWTNTGRIIGSLVYIA